jgi:hypothetical protein
MGIGGRRLKKKVMETGMVGRGGVVDGGGVIREWRSGAAQDGGRDAGRR